MPGCAIGSKIKNADAPAVKREAEEEPAVKREAEEDWGKERWR